MGQKGSGISSTVQLICCLNINRQQVTHYTAEKEPLSSYERVLLEIITTTAITAATNRDIL